MCSELLPSKNTGKFGSSDYALSLQPPPQTLRGNKTSQTPIFEKFGNSEFIQKKAKKADTKAAHGHARLLGGGGPSRQERRRQGGGARHAALGGGAQPALARPRTALSATQLRLLGPQVLSGSFLRKLPRIHTHARYLMSFQKQLKTGEPKTPTMPGLILQCFPW